ncbi:MBL fold metallo-hydrolase [Candidatus Entotheonella palauensis]|uniref:MBL fold metallo-hydrolase n=1 Tax=Candidatus Entotheonella palauensis TaxID=93172 RepID=UPI000B7D0CF0|nr:MBL fold metallo-hydrolase [Candidatus Entotheonella palauensis]
MRDASDTNYNLKIHLYGVQGSGSIFMSRAERRDYHDLMDLRLLEQVFKDLSKYARPDGQINCTLEQILGGELSPQTLRAYRKRFDIEEARVYGGWTTCVRIETGDGHDIVIDLGSGFRNCARDLQNEWGDRGQRHLSILGTHSHYDHTEGFDQAAVCFDPRNTIRIYGNRQYLQAIDQNLGIFTHEVDANLLGVQTPLYYEIMPAAFESYEIRDLSRYPPPEPGNDRLAQSYHHLSDPIRIGATTITAVEVFHPAPCLTYRIEHGGKVFVFCTDHELRHGGDPDDPKQKASMEAEERLRQLAYGADVMYRDGQFFRAEYDGMQGIGESRGVSRVDWGHSCIEDVLEMAEACQVQTTYIGHHDPNRDWAERNWITEGLKRKSEQTGLGFKLAEAESIIML